MSTAVDAEVLRAAFRDVHAARLHGFALLLTLGDRGLAGDVTSQALGEGARRVRELRHPERAAAWLRAQVLGYVRRRLRAEPDAASSAARLAAVRGMGADARVLRQLAALSITERAALVAADVEHLAEADVAMVLGSSWPAARRRVAAARARYLGATDEALWPGPDVEPGQPRQRGALTERVLLIAARTFSPSGPR